MGSQAGNWLRGTCGWVVALCGGLAAVSVAAAQDLPQQDLPHLQRTGQVSQLVVHGKPMLLLAGELGNSSAGTAAQADEILPRLAAEHVNTVLMPVAWEQLEPAEDQFDFSILDHWVATARAQHLHLVLLWFGAWKNGFSSYAPAWVKQNPERFPRVIGEDGRPREILSTLAQPTLRADARAFARLLGHLRETDAGQQTVLMVQVENEVGILGSGRDRSRAADEAFRAPVPANLVQALRSAPLAGEMSPELRAVFHPEGRTWTEMFGRAAPEVFTAWNYARYINTVAAAGKAEYPLPMYVNTQLPSPFERAGEYPSGGPHPYFLAVYRAGAPALDFFSPDIYWPEFEYWLNRYRFGTNALFVPEARLDSGSWNALYAFGQAGAFGFSPFGIESGQTTDGPDGDHGSSVAEAYRALAPLQELLLPAQAENRTAAVVLHARSPRPTETVALGGYLFTATLARSWPANTLLQDNGAVLLLQLAPEEFLLLGNAMQVTVARDADFDSGQETGRDSGRVPGRGLAGLESVEEGSYRNGTWVATRRLNGDQTNQGRTLTLPAHSFTTLRIRLYTTPVGQAFSKGN